LANSKSALKRVRVAERNRLQNRPYRSASRTLVKKAEFAIQDLQGETVEQAQVQDAISKAVAMLDRSARKGVIHPNNAARRKSRLLKKYNAATAAGA
jgi:small subunit ribosomal protein S20